MAICGTVHWLDLVRLPAPQAETALVACALTWIAADPGALTKSTLVTSRCPCITAGSCSLWRRICRAVTTRVRVAHVSGGRVPAAGARCGLRLRAGRPLARICTEGVARSRWFATAVLVGGLGVVHRCPLAQRRSCCPRDLTHRPGSRSCVDQLRDGAGPSPRSKQNQGPIGGRHGQPNSRWHLPIRLRNAWTPHRDWKEVLEPTAVRQRAFAGPDGTPERARQQGRDGVPKQLAVNPRQRGPSAGGAERRLFLRHADGKHMPRIPAVRSLSAVSARLDSRWRPGYPLGAAQTGQRTLCVRPQAHVLEGSATPWLRGVST